MLRRNEDPVIVVTGQSRSGALNPVRIITGSVTT